jgi:hypothetical protein
MGTPNDLLEFLLDAAHQIIVQVQSSGVMMVYLLELGGNILYLGSRLLHQLLQIGDLLEIIIVVDLQIEILLLSSALRQEVRFLLEVGIFAK